MSTENILTFPFNTFDYPFNIEIAGISHIDNNNNIHRENCYCYILEYTYSGTGIVICDNKKFIVEPGDVCILPKGSNHEYHTDTTWDKIWFNIDGILVPNILMAYNLNNKILFKNFNNKTDFQELYKILDSNEDKQKIMNDAALLFHKIIQKLQLLQKNYPLNNKINTIKSMLDESIFDEKISIKAITEQLCLSQTQIINLFKQTFNITPYQYFIKKRIETAATLLLNTDLSINEISEKLHFTDQPHFTNSFKKYMGISPENYKRSNIDVYKSRSNINNKFQLEGSEFLPFDLKVKRK